MRKPLMISGSAAGSTTFQGITHFGVPRLQADQTNCLLMPRAALKVVTTTGSRQPRNTAATLVESPMPSHRMKRGMSADFGSGKLARSRGSRILRATRLSAISMPDNMPSTAARKKPLDWRNSEMPAFSTRCPCSINRTKAVSTAPSEGNSVGSSRPKRPRSSHNASKAKIGR